MESTNRIMALSQMNDAVDFATVVREAADKAQERFDKWSEKIKKARRARQCRNISITLILPPMLLMKHFPSLMKP